MNRFYHSAPIKTTECHHCGEIKVCEVLISDPEPETGYVDEHAICGECMKLDPHNEPFGPTDIFGNDWRDEQ